MVSKKGLALGCNTTIMKQSEIFLESEGQAWYERNKDKLPPEHDPVMEAIEKAGITPHNVLEVGCGNGWRLNLLTDKYTSCNAWGVDPGLLETRAYADLHLISGTAIELPHRDGFQRPFEFDLIIYGFCLYLVDREDLFKVVAEGDRVLQDGGHLVIHDFHPEYPHKVKYKHKEGLFSYKMDHAQLWLANPAYKLRSRVMCADETSVTILKKDIDNGWPIKD